MSVLSGGEKALPLLVLVLVLVLVPVLVPVLVLVLVLLVLVLRRLHTRAMKRWAAATMPAELHAIPGPFPRILGLGAL